ncbi:MAG TPA: DUF2075 domain-containing protein [Actinomycetota bacterium]|nr:DUF2075 domain-containing protein [Actinomycetota bacterium]
MLLAQLVDDRAVPRLTQQYAIDVGHRPAAAEVRSWRSSLPVLMADLVDAGLSGVEVLVEHRLPLSSKRTDVILAGSHPKTSEPSFVVVELKQWSDAQIHPDDVDLVTVGGYGTRPVLHPGRQVQNYVQYLVDFVRALEGRPDAVAGAAYLHNAAEARVGTLRRRPETEAGRLFTGQERGQWLQYLTTRLAPDGAAQAADLLLGSAVAPSKQLMTLAAAEIQDREQFVLLDEQEVAYRLVLNAVRNATRADHKSVIVVTGGPGSGKSVIALSLLGELFRQGRTAEHATGSKAFTETLRRVAGHRNPRVKQLFGYFNQFATDEPNSLDVLILDEAHRIRETSNSRFTPRTRRSSKAQVQELIEVARVPVFLLDEHQVVRPGEIGTVAAIRAAAQQRGLDVQEVALDAQFRAGGSRLYEEWVLRLLGLIGGGPIRWAGDENYTLLVADTPAQMEQFLAQRLAQGYGARMSAGFCWPWSDAVRGEPLVPDVRIGDWARPWNNKEERRHEGAPARSLWATEKGGFDQVGCVYTAQGFEYDWSGVILGPDLVWRDGRFISDVRASRDPAFRGKHADGFDVFVRNVYKVLLTRGMVGTVIYSTDAQTREMLKGLIDDV